MALPNGLRQAIWYQMTCLGGWSTISAARKQGQGNHRIGMSVTMQTVVLTNDPVQISFVRALLRDAGIECLVFDEFASGVEGSIGAIPRRLVVADDDAAEARLILAESGAM